MRPEDLETEFFELMVSSPQFSCLNMGYHEVRKLSHSERKKLIKKLNEMRREEKKALSHRRNSLSGARRPTRPRTRV